MPATSQPTDQPYGQLITDEAVLERLFRAHYVRLVADAKRRLGDSAAAAPRVVSKAFHLAWTDRKRFHSEEELDAFLGANIQHGASREISRRADSSSGQSDAVHDVAEMDVDEAWDRLKHTLHGGTPEAYRKRASTARHEAAEHMADLAKERSWKPYVVIGAIGVALVLGVMWIVDRVGAERVIVNSLAAEDARKYETSYGQQMNITLVDGTIVRLGPETRITVPENFGPKLRAVKLEGTAQFGVLQDMDNPFQVRAGNAAVIAHGTTFTIRKYADDANIVVHVTQGAVEVTVGDETRNVAEGTSQLVTDSGGLRPATPEELSEATAWVTGKVTITGHTLRYVLPQLKRWYGLDIKVPDARLLERTVFLSAPMNSPKEAIASVEQSGGLKFTYIGEDMAFQDTAPARGASRRR